MSFEENYRAGIESMKTRIKEELGADTDVYDTDEMQSAFETKSFSSPFITVIRKADQVRGTLQFSNSPRVYFKFIPS